MSTGSLQFTGKEIEMIRKTWSILMDDPQESGGLIFIEYFTNDPESQAKFPKFKGKPADELITVPQFLKHGGMIMHIFDDSIQSLGGDNCEAKIDGIWRKIAETHFWRHHVTRHSFCEFKAAVIGLLKRVCKLNNEQVSIWTRLLDALHNKLFSIYEEYEALEKVKN